MRTTTEITVLNDMREMFVSSCHELRLDVELLNNTDSAFVYSVHCYPNDLYYLGRMVGLKIGNEIAINGILNAK